MKPYRIFISSTIDDLHEARSDAEKCLRALEVFEPVRVETLPAYNQPSDKLCLDEVRKADAILLLLGPRYGYIPSENNEEHLSVTHIEYREARKLGIPVFAFVKEGGDRDPDQERLVTEVEGFSSGVFRKTWSTTEALSQEVSRSFIWWIARLARSSEPNVASRIAVSATLKSQKLDHVRVTLDSSFDDDSSLSHWIHSAIDQAQQYAVTDLLPQPILTDSSTADDGSANFTLRLARTDSPPLIRMEILVEQILLDKGGPSNKGEAKTVRFTFLELEPLQETLHIAASLIKCLLFLIAEDPQRCTKSLLQLIREDLINEPSRSAILQTAAYLDLKHGLEHSFLIAQEVLSLKEPTSVLINLSTHSLIIAYIKLSLRGLGAGHNEVSKILCLLFKKGLALGVSGAEALYSLARQLLNTNPHMALPLYQLLIKFHPFYDERWYWHRDLGLLFYTQGKYGRAALHYDAASRLKNDDSELFRFAGDAYFYAGCWMEALSRYQRAMSIESVEKYFLDGKIAFCERKLRSRIQRERLWGPRRILALQVSKLGVRLAEWNLRKIPKILFRVTQSFCPTEYSAAKWLALFANERGDYSSSIRLLTVCLYSLPENYSDRLNLTLNLIFQAGGKWTEPAMKHARAAIFFASTAARDRFRICLINTASKEELLTVMETTLLPQVKEERDAWRQRRQEVLKPQKFGEVLHMEFRP